MIARLKSLSPRQVMALTAVAVLILLAVLAVFVDWGLVLRMMANADRPLLAASIVMLFLGYGAYAARWRFVLARRPRYSAVFHTANAGTMVNMLLPGRPGDAARVLLLAGKTGTPVFTAASSIVVERWYEQIMRLAALGGALVFGAGAQASLLPMLGSVGYLVGSFILMVFMLRRRDWVLASIPPLIARLPRLEEPQVRHWLAELIAGLDGVASVRSLSVALVWSALTWAFFWGFHFLCLLSLHPAMAPNQLLAISLGSLALAPPSATTLPGVYQMSVVVPLALVGYNRDLLTTYSLVMNIVEMAVVLLLGAWGAFAAGLTLHQLFAKSRGPEAEEVQALLE